MGAFLALNKSVPQIDKVTEGIDALLEIGSPAGSKYSVSATLPPHSKRDPIPEDGVSLDGFTVADLLAAALSGQGSNKTAVVEHIGFEPMTSSMPLKRATNCANAPYLAYCSKNPPRFLGRVCCAATRPPGARFCFQTVCFIPKAAPLAYQRDFIMHRIVAKFKLMLVLFYKMCLNNSVQKHAHIKAKGGRLPLGVTLFFARYP